MSPLQVGKEDTRPSTFYHVLSSQSDSHILHKYKTLQSLKSTVAWWGRYQLLRISNSIDFNVDNPLSFPSNKPLGFPQVGTNLLDSGDHSLGDGEVSVLSVQLSSRPSKLRRGQEAGQALALLGAGEEPCTHGLDALAP